MKQFWGNVNMFIEFFSFFYVFFRVDIRKRTGIRTVGMISCILVWLVGLFINFDWRGSLLGPFPVYLFWIYLLLYIIFEVTIVEIILFGIGEWSIMCMLEAVLYIMLEYMNFNRDILENMIMVIVSCAIWMFYFVIGKRTAAQTFKLPIKMWCLLDAIMVTLTAMLSFFTYVIVQELPGNKTMVMGKTLFAVGEALIVVLLFSVIYYYNSTHNFRIQKELAERQNEQQREYFLQLLEKEKETRDFRHDIVNDLLEMQNFCEKKKCKQLESYLESTLGTLQRISKSSYDVGNDIVNTVLNYYLQPLREKYNVEVSGYMGDDISIEQRDLCVLSANLIKNASEAVSKMDIGEIGVKIDQGRKYLSIQVKNSFDGQIGFDKRGIPKTSKQDKKNHGIGIHNIRQIIKKYDGIYNTNVTEGTYQVEICLKI